MTLTSENMAQKVHDAFVDCLFRDDEIDGATGLPKEMVVVEGVMGKFGFHPGRLESHRAEVEDCLRELPDEFLETKGGGWSFLNAAMDRHGNQWAEHRTIDELVMLGIGLKDVAFLMPRDMWSVLPGGMPYFVVRDSVMAPRSTSGT